MRQSRDVLDERGFVYDGFDYAIQVWVVDGIVQRCGHPDRMRLGGVPCCNADRYAGQQISDVPGAERRGSA